MRGVILARRCKRQKSSTRTRDDDERRVEYRDSENENWRKPIGGRIPGRETELEAQGRHEETEEHRAAITHENSRWREIPAQKTECSAEARGCQSAYNGLAGQSRGDYKERCSNGSDSGTQSVHMIEDAERRRD